MNVPELEQVRTKMVRANDSNDKETVCCIDYLNKHFYKNLQDSIIAQKGWCEQTLIKTKWTYERNAIEREIQILKLILDLLEY